MLSELDKQIIRELQEDFPICARPYQVIADKIGISEEQLLKRIEEFIKTGIIRRYGAALRHREAGFVANAMIVWRVPEEQVAEIGRKMAGFPEVTHCYHRVSYPPDWPFNLFTMVHGQTKEECEETAAKMAQATGLTDYKLLYSTRELKKTSMKYYVDRL